MDVHSHPCGDKSSKDGREKRENELTGLGGFDELHIEGDGDVFADEHAAGFECGVVGEIEVLAVDLGGGDETNALVAPGVLGWIGELLHVEGDRLGDAM